MARPRFGTVRPGFKSRASDQSSRTQIYRPRRRSCDTGAVICSSRVVVLTLLVGGASRMQLSRAPFTRREATMMARTPATAQSLSIGDITFVSLPLFLQRSCSAAQLRDSVAHGPRTGAHSG